MDHTEVQEFVNSLRSTFSSFEVCCLLSYSDFSKYKHIFDNENS
jgi:hypothetical protein